MTPEQIKRIRDKLKAVMERDEAYSDIILSQEFAADVVRALDWCLD